MQTAIKGGLLIFTVAFATITQMSSVSAQVITDADVNAITGGWPHYDETEGAGLCGISAGTEVEGDANQDEHAKTIIGIAKSLNLGQKGALIGIMTSLVETNLKNYANDGTWTDGSGNQPYAGTGLGTISTSLPHDAVGNDHDSVGLMQQRAVDGNWGPVDPDENLEENIRWLMTPAYSAMAFFSMPQGKKDNKALVNVDNWENRPPGEVAQAVQGSAFPDRYAEREGEAQGYINRLWEDSPAINLPVPLAEDAGEELAEQTFDPSALCSSGVFGSAQERILQVIAQYAWPDYCRADSRNCSNRPSGKDMDWATTPKPEYKAAITKAQDNGEYDGDECNGLDNPLAHRSAIDCGAFTTRVMRDSGADPEFNKYEGNTTDQFRYLKEAAAAGKYKLVPESEPLQPGDVAIRYGHTFFFVGDAMKTYAPNWNGGIAASASQCERAPMAGGNDTRSNYSWYRLVQQ